MWFCTGPARFSRLVSHEMPVGLVGRHLDVVAVRASVTVPQQQSAARENVMMTHNLISRLYTHRWYQQNDAELQKEIS